MGMPIAQWGGLGRGSGTKRTGSTDDHRVIVTWRGPQKVGQRGLEGDHLDAVARCSQLAGVRISSSQSGHTIERQHRRSPQPRACAPATEPLVRAQMPHGSDARWRDAASFSLLSEVVFVVVVVPSTL